MYPQELNQLIYIFIAIGIVAWIIGAFYVSKQRAIARVKHIIVVLESENGISDASVRLEEIFRVMGNCSLWPEDVGVDGYPAIVKIAMDSQLRHIHYAERMAEETASMAKSLGISGDVSAKQLTYERTLLACMALKLTMITESSSCDHSPASG